ncbi:hypothetical protein Back11_41840 [Paenibacillus baekrokdamisoli]|uniref:Uncharacterized protein n=1 Tax=Paenibacillus baekrokdamisoli TaxID=1712516 RepID=A0A3G9JIJ2_9BACL|nr:hypothetical protein [Paenibacillus baekrokdamisoli]MBB3068117.1 hypothetical protein [Paenibacillus baekrokdamisoli]BBH22839.1 hypothetical protein Back11_41840 [Paenibacillus baekrokdamisoli]
MMNKYVEGMKEIKAGKDFKEKLILSARSTSVDPNPNLQGTGTRRRKLSMFAACMLIIICAFGLLIALNNGNNDASQVKTIFNGFIMTAYAADGAPVPIKPDIAFPLGQYQLTMSNVPGFPIAIVCDDADSITLKVSDGELLLWAPPDYKVKPQHKRTTLQSGERIYWTPLVGEIGSHRVTSSTLQITAYKNNKELGSRLIEIKSEDGIHYIGKLVDH